MYLYLGIFNNAVLENKRCSISNNFLESIKKVSPDYKNLNDSEIDGCIIYKLYKNFSNENALVLEKTKVSVFDKFINIEFNNYKELNITNEQIKNSIYRFACTNDWIDSDNIYPPIICIVDKANFDLIRKGTPNTRKISSNNAQIDKMKSDDNWKGICDIYEPLEKINENEIWNNAYDLYNIAYACSKIGEVKNGMERDKNHLNTVKRYRDLSILLYTRCISLAPSNHTYFSSLAYRYYLNVSELTKAKGRRDGKINEEMQNALIWLNKSLELNPNNIKDNYRKGKLIIDKQISNYKYSNNRKWVKQDFDDLKGMEIEGVRSLNQAITDYEQITSIDEKNRNFKEYIKSIYTLACFYVENPNNHINEYISSKISNHFSEGEISGNDIKCYKRALSFLKKCLLSEMKVPEDTEINIENIILDDNPEISYVDVFYRIGCAFLNLYCIYELVKTEESKIEYYRANAEKYLFSSYNLSLKLKSTGRLNRNTWFISDKLAQCYILERKYDEAIKLIDKARDSYIKNTLAVALILTDKKENIEKAKEKLNEACNDKYNKANKFSEYLQKQIENRYLNGE